MLFLYLSLSIKENWNMSQILRQILADNVKKLRLKQGYKKEELSLLLNVDNSYISKLEKMKVNITLDKLQSLAKIFNVEAHELIKADK